MYRLFQTNKIRKQTELEGMWDFALIEGEMNGQEPVRYTCRMPVPGCWELHPGLEKYRGQAIYRRSVTVTRHTHLRFRFQGVSHTAKVYFDGKQIAEHYNAYTAFEAVVRHVDPGEHELTVWVDNSFNENSSLHVPNDYYTYGGIIRPVVAEEIEDLFIERIRFTPSMGDGGHWSADVQVKIANLGEQTRKARLQGTLAGTTLNFQEEEIPAGRSAIVSGNFVFGNVQAWSHETPQLYMLDLQLYANGEAVPIDDLNERVGFRTVTTQNGRIQVNGKDVVLKGFNRHEDHPMAGAALTLPLMVQDLKLVLDMGANCVRTSHYPNDDRFLDLCDEHGVYVWEENHARGLSLEQMRHPNFIVQCEQVNREMVEQHGNHPSIVIWGILNECASDTEEGREHYKRQIEQIRTLDASRPITFASDKRNRELCFDLADIVSFNLYPGWYGDEDPGQLCDQAKGWAEAAGGVGKPMIMSEFGGDGYYGYRDPSRVRGTEERHADIIEANLAAYHARPYLSGMLIWQFCDCRVTEGTGWLLTRAGTQNSKGIVDKYRRPKLAYDVVKKWFRPSSIGNSKNI